MTSLKDFTTIPIPIGPSPFPTSIGIDGIIAEENRWRLDVMEKTFAHTLSTGAVLSISLLSIAFLFFTIFIATLVYPLPFVSTKLALFISLFSGALGIEVLAAKKDKKIRCLN